MPDGSIVTSANLTSDEQTGLGNWSAEEFVRFFKFRENKGLHGPALKPGEMQTPMPWVMYAGMDTTDLYAMYTYLHSLKPVKNKVEIFTPAGDVAAK